MNEKVGERISDVDLRWRVAKADPTTPSPFVPRIVRIVAMHRHFQEYTRRGWFGLVESERNGQKCSDQGMAVRPRVARRPSSSHMGCR